MKTSITLPSGLEIQVCSLDNRDSKELASEYYIEYAKYLINSRVLPNIKDGLKPSQRRLVVAGNSLPKNKFVKSAKLLGNTLEYHPHGDSGLYSALIGLTSNSNVVNIFQGKGNWGGFDCPAAAYRYTEAYLSPFGQFCYSQFLNKADIWVGESGLDEPESLPALLPFSDISGASGIGVGLSTNIMPLNLMEVIDYYIATIKGDPKKKVPTPDIGNFILDMDDDEIDRTTRGIDAKLRVKSNIIQESERILVIEGTFNKSIEKVLDRIDDLLSSGKVDFRDESKGEPRYVIEICDTSVNAKELISRLNQLTTGNASYTRLVYDGDVAVYCDLDYQVSKVLEYLNKCLDKKFTDELSSYQFVENKLKAMNDLKSSGILNRIGTLTTKELQDEIVNLGYTEEIAKSVSGSPISYLTKSHDSELVDIQAKINENKSHNRTEYLVELYEELKKLAKPIYDSKKHTVRRSMLLKTPRISVTGDTELLVSNKGLSYDQEVLVIMSDGEVIPVQAFSNLKRVIELTNVSGKIVGIVPDTTEEFAVVTNKEGILSRTYESVGYRRSIITLSEDEEVVRVITDSEFTENKKSYSIKSYLKSRVSKPNYGWR